MKTQTKTTQTKTTQTKTTQTKNGELEGEGSYTATRRYNQGLAESIKKGNSDELARKAEKALDGPEGAALREAEKIGKSGKPARKQERPAKHA